LNNLLIETLGFLVIASQALIIMSAITTRDVAGFRLQSLTLD
jgi:hypothetical protein